MATRNRTPLYRKDRDALRHVRAPLDPSAPSSSSSYGGGGPVIELSSAPFLRSGHRSYAPLSTTDEYPCSSSRGALIVGLPPVWVDVSEEISVNMQHARAKMSVLVKAHAKALMPSFANSREDHHFIETLEITDLLGTSEKKLQKLSSSELSEDSNV